MQRMPKPMVQAAVCGTCAHYHQHYVLGGKKFVPLWYGHCVASKLKDRILTRPASAGRKTTARNETSHSNNDRGTVFSVGPFPTGEPSSRSGRGKPLPYITYGNVRVQMLMYGKVSQENYVELTAASAIPNKEIKSPQILRY